MPTPGADTLSVLVDPPEAWERRRRLFTAIEEALHIRITPRSSQPATACAAIVFGKNDAVSTLPTISLPSGVPEVQDHLMEIRFATDTRIDRALRGASLAHRALALDELPGVAEHEVLARAGRKPVWVRHGNMERVAVGISELGGSEPLRSRLASASFLPLVSIIDFLRRLVPEPFTPPPLSAAFLFDDPNLHSTSYGYLDYNSLVAEAQEAGYHVAFATIPLDTWYASRAAVELFRSHRDVLSLVIHGNNHVRRELAQPLDVNARRALLAQGLRRIEQFERRHGVSVARVMAPPHGACSEAMAAELPLVGYDALCVSRPYPWLEAPPRDRVLAGWRPAEIIASGLPIVPRLHLGADRGEIVLRAFLHQPIILYGHHSDVRDGLDVLRKATKQVNAVGDVRWTSLSEILTTLHEVRVQGKRLHIRLYSRTATVNIPEDVSDVTVEWPASPDSDRILVAGQTTDQLRLPPGSSGTLDVRVERRNSPELSADRSGGNQVWPYVRRGLAEARDRVLPFTSWR